MSTKKIGLIAVFTVLLLAGCTQPAGDGTDTTVVAEEKTFDVGFQEIKDVLNNNSDLLEVRLGEPSLTNASGTRGLDNALMILNLDKVKLGIDSDKGDGRVLHSLVDLYTQELWVEEFHETADADLRTLTQAVSQENYESLCSDFSIRNVKEYLNAAVGLQEAKAYFFENYPAEAALIKLKESEVTAADGRAVLDTINEASELLETACQ